MLQIFNGLNYIFDCIRKSNTKDKQHYTHLHIHNMSMKGRGEGRGYRAEELIMYAHPLKNLDKQSVRKPKWGAIALSEVSILFIYFLFLDVCVHMCCHIFACMYTVFHFFFLFSIVF